MKVINESRIDFKYKASLESPIITKTIMSNIVATTILNSTLVVKKSVDKVHACLYDTLLYTIEISNINNEIINNVILKDIIPSGTKFINNTLFVDEVIKRCENPNNGILLCRIAGNTNVIIKFKVVISSVNCLAKITNSCMVTFDYIDDIEKPPMKISVYSNEVITICKENLFKQFMVNNTINICDLNRSIDYLIKVETEVKIISTKLMNSVLNTKTHNAIFIGSLKYKIYYKYKGKLCTFICIRGFSTTLLVPKGIEYFEKINVKIYNEDTSYFLINKSTVFITNYLFIADSLLIK